MKKFLSISLLVFMLIGVTSGCTKDDAKDPDTSGDANVEDNSGDIGNKLVLYSSMTENDLTNLVEGFNKEYPDVNIEIVNGSAGELTARIKAEQSNPQGDLMWGGISDSDGDEYADIFENWLSDHEDEVLDAYKSNNGYVNLDHLSTAVFCVNTDLEKELGLDIKGYPDLLDPALSGKIVMPDPNSSSSAWNNMSNIMSVYGINSDESWDYIEQLLRNKLIISTSSSVAFQSVQTGEYVVGLTYEDGAATLLKSGAENVRMVYPEEGTSASAFGCAVIKDAPNMEAAKAMVNYIMSAEGQTYLGNALGTLRFTNSKAEYETPYLPATSEVKWVDRDVEAIKAEKDDILEKWNTLFNEIN